METRTNEKKIHHVKPCASYVLKPICEKNNDADAMPVREVEAERAKKQVNVVEQEILSSPTSSIPSLADGSSTRDQELAQGVGEASSGQQIQDNVAGQEAVAPTQSSALSSRASPRQNVMSNIIPPRQRSSTDKDLAILVPYKPETPSKRSSRVALHAKKARSRLCRGLGVEPNDTFATTTLAGLLKAATRLRLIDIPHQGSILDRSIKKIESLARSLNTFAGSLDNEEAVRLCCMTCWACCEILLGVSVTTSRIKVLV